MQHYRTAVAREQLIHTLNIQLICNITTLPLIEEIKKSIATGPNGSHWLNG